MRKTKKIEQKLYIVPSREDLLERYCEKYTERIERCYQQEWDLYCQVMRAFLKGRFTNDLRVLMIDHIEPIPKDLSTRFTSYEKSEYCQYLFRHAVCMDYKDQKVGKIIEYELPVAFKIYIKKERFDRLANQGMPKTFCIKDFNSIRDICVKSIRSKLNQYGFDCRPIDEGIQNRFEFFTINIIQRRKYNASEDMLIKGKRDREMNIVTNYQPNKMFFKFQKQSIFAIENDRSEESMFATIGLILLASAVAGTGLAVLSEKEKHKRKYYEIKASTKFFSPAEVDQFDGYINDLSKDINHIESSFDSYINGSSKNKVVTYIEDNIRQRDINEQRLDITRDRIVGDDKLQLELRFVGEDEDYDSLTNNATFITGSVDNVLVKLDRAKEFTNKKIINEPFTNSKSKIVEIYDSGEIQKYSGKVTISRTIIIELPKDIIELVKTVRARVGSTEAFLTDGVFVMRNITEIKNAKSWPKTKKKIEAWMEDYGLRPSTMKDMVNSYKDILREHGHYANELRFYKIENVDGISVFYIPKYISIRSMIIPFVNLITAPLSYFYNAIKGRKVANLFAIGTNSNGKVNVKPVAEYAVYIDDADARTRDNVASFMAELAESKNHGKDK